MSDFEKSLPGSLSFPSRLKNLLGALLALGLLALLPGLARAAAGPELVVSRHITDYYLFPEAEVTEYGDGVYSQIVLATVESRNLFESMNVASWELEQTSGRSARAELSSWYQEAQTSLLLTQLPSEDDCGGWKIFCNLDDGNTLETEDLSVYFKSPPEGMTLPEGWELVSLYAQDGKWAADPGEAIRPDDVFRFTGGWTLPDASVTAEISSYSSDFWDHRTDLGSGSFSMNASGVYPVIVTLRCCNIETVFSIPLYIRDANGNLPVPVPDVSLNSYGMDITGSGEARFYIADGLPIADPVPDRAFSLPGIMTCTVGNMDLFPEGLAWRMTRTDGNAGAVLNTRNNGMNADLDMAKMPTSAGDSVFEIECLYENQVVWSSPVTVHVVRLTSALPTGNQQTGGLTAQGLWYADVGDYIWMSHFFDFTNGWRVPGESHLMVSMDSGDDRFWESVGCGEGLYWGMDLRQKGKYPVTVITSCYNISWAHEYTLYVGVQPYTRITGDTLRLPADLKEIGAESFAKTNAQAVVIPAGCERIGASAFAGSPRLVEVEIPESVTQIDADAFKDCPSLQVFITRSRAAIDYADQAGIQIADE